MAHCAPTQEFVALERQFTIALAGNPNAGKSTIFNALTGARQHVGNWPGKTVEKKSGILRLDEHEIAVVDLPGTYSLTAFSIEELIARDFIVEHHPNAVIAVVDAANLERNLYLVLQLLEMDVPLLIALNMTDVAERRQISIDEHRLRNELDVPIIRTVGNREIGLSILKGQIHNLATEHWASSKKAIEFNTELETEIKQLQTLIEADPLLAAYPARWFAIKLLENDERIVDKIAHTAALQTALKNSVQKLTLQLGEDPEILIADARYAWINQITQSVVTRPKGNFVSPSEKIDRVLTHRLLGIPIFFTFMWIVFQLTAHASTPFVDWMDAVITGPITHGIARLLSTLSLQGTWVESLLLDGIIAGVGGVIVFVPVLFFLYFAIAILEDSGYMARAAFVMDRFMSLIGLHGKSFLPMLVGFGCNVPGIYATRTLDNEQDRKITAFLTTFMSCGARLPVYVIFGAAFFGASSGNLIFGMYLLGIGIAVLTSLLMTKIVYRSKPAAPFVMELPPYRVPDMKSVMLNMWQRTIAFVRKAGTVILLASIAIWFLLAIPITGKTNQFAQVKPQDSIFGSLSEGVSPALAPAGFGEWEASGSLITGLVAKEVIVTSMTQVYVDDSAVVANETGSFRSDVSTTVTGFGEATLLTIEEIINIVPRTANLLPNVNMPEANLLGQETIEEDHTALAGALQSHFTPLAAVTFSVFVLLYVPCMTTIGAMRHEFGPRWMAIHIVYTLCMAWLVATIVYQGGQLLGWGG